MTDLAVERLTLNCKGCGIYIAANFIHQTATAFNRLNTSMSLRIQIHRFSKKEEGGGEV